MQRAINKLDRVRQAGTMPPTVAAAPGRETVFSDATVNYFRDAAIMYPDAVEGKSNYVHSGGRHLPSRRYSCRTQHELLQGHPIYKNPHFRPKSLGVMRGPPPFGELRVLTRRIKFTFPGAPRVLPTTNFWQVCFFSLIFQISYKPLVEAELVPLAVAAACP